MIDFRYHLVSIVAVFLALTVGLVLGTTMLQDPLLESMQSETADLRGQSEDLRVERDEAELLNAGADQLARATAGEVLTDRLKGVELVVVTAPGVDEDVVHGLGERAEEAGAEVTGRVLIRDALLAEDGATFVDELALQVSDAPTELTGGAHDKAGAELGRALVVRQDDDEGGHAAATLAAFEEGGLITVQGSPATAARALIVVAPTGPAEEEAESATTALLALTGAMNRQVGATVLAGGTEAAHEGGVIARALAEDASYSTVDVAGRPAGDVVVALALAEALDGGRGAYGVGEGASGFLPEPLPEARSGDAPSEIEADAAARTTE
ncbi:copper transporter [Nocardiopsis sp. NPDC055551]